MASSFDIQDAPSTVSGARLPALDAFTLGPEQVVNPGIVLSGPHIAPLFLDIAGSRVFFAEAPRHLDLRQAAFAFVELYSSAQRLYALSFDELRAVVRSLAPPPGLGFLFNTSRCGSTLLHRVFNSVPTVSSIGELSIVADMEQWLTGGGEPEQVTGVLRDVLSVFASHFNGTVMYKYLSGCTALAALHHTAFPQAKKLFLYRNAVDWAASWQRIRDRSGIQSVDMSLWLQSMDAYRLCRDAGVPFTALRYEDLCGHPRAMLSQLFTLLGWSQDSLNEALLAFESDAQAGTVLARDEGRPNTYRLNAQQRRSVEAQLRQHEPPWASSPYLAGTLPMPRDSEEPQ